MSTTFNIGDHLVSSRIGYFHHGIYIGNDQVIHYSGFVDGLARGVISIATLYEFSCGNRINVKNYLIRTYNRERSVQRAFERMGEDWYNVVLNNCEHFVTWCIQGIHSSSQVNRLVDGIATMSFTAAQKEVQQRALQAAINLLPGKALRHLVEAGTGYASVPTTLSYSTAATAGLTAASSVVVGSTLMAGGVTTVATCLAAPVLVPATILFAGCALLFSLFD